MSIKAFFEVKHYTERTRTSHLLFSLYANDDYKFKPQI